MTPTPPVDPHALRALATAILEHSTRVGECLARNDHRAAGRADSERNGALQTILVWAEDPTPLIAFADALDTSQREVSRLSAALGEAEKDTKRLDGMASITGEIDQTISPPGNHGGQAGNWLLTHEYQAAPWSREWEGKTLREAIDAASLLPSDAEVET